MVKERACSAAASGAPVIANMHAFGAEELHRLLRRDVEDFGDGISHRPGFRHRPPVAPPRSRSAPTRRRGGAGKPRGEGIGVHGVEGLRAIKRGAQGVMAVGRVDGPAQRGARGTAARLRHAPVDQTAP